VGFRINIDIIYMVEHKIRRLTSKDMHLLKLSAEKPMDPDHTCDLQPFFIFSPGEGCLVPKTLEVCFGCGYQKFRTFEDVSSADISKLIVDEYNSRHS